MKMYKSFKILVILLILVNLSILKVDAKSAPTLCCKEITTIKIGDGITKEIITEQYNEKKITRQSSTRSGRKTINYKNGSTILWSLTVYGNFTYNGTSAICTSASVSTTCPASDWKIKSAYAAKSGSTAIGYVTSNKYVWGIVVKTINDDVSLTCSKTGELS